MELIAVFSGVITLVLRSSQLADNDPYGVVKMELFCFLSSTGWRPEQASFKP